MTDYAFYFLGPPRLEYHNQRLTLARQKSLGLLAYLALTGEAQLRAHLATLLWPEVPTAQALGSLRRALVDVRQVLGGDLLAVTQTSVALVPGTAWIDVVQFQHLLAQTHDHSPSQVCPACLPRLEEALALVRGEFLAGFSLRASAPFEAWQSQQALQLRQAEHAVLAKLVRGYMEGQNYARALQVVQRWAALEPFHEPAQQALMRLYALQGQRTQALQAYEAFHTQLACTSEVTVEPETTALYEAIRAGAFPPLIPFSVGHLPPVGTGAAMTQPPQAPPPEPIMDFPVVPTSFCDREAELTHLVTRLQHPDCRLLTLLGMGGIGKTRLALEVARTLAQERLVLTATFPNGIYFLALEALTQREALLSQIADKLGLACPPQATLEAQVIQGLKGKRLLLILDNFDPLVAEAPLLTALLQAAPGLKLLITSRERLALEEEEELELQGLAYPPLFADGEAGPALETYGAVQLFFQRVRRIHPHFILDETHSPWLIKLCHLLDGLPLGLELATETLRHTSLQALVESLVFHPSHLQSTSRNRAPRHAQLRALFDSSWARLTPSEQTAYARLSIFSGEFPLSAAQAVGLAPETLFTLQDKSLVAPRAETRYALHPILKELAAEKLAANRESLYAASAAFATYYLHFLARHQAPHELRPALAEIALEVPNIHRAWTLALALGWFDLVEAALASYYGYFLGRGLSQEGALVFQLAAQMLLIKEAGPLRGKMCTRQGHFLVLLGQLPEAQACFTEGLHWAIVTADRQELAFSQFLLALLAETSE